MECGGFSPLSPQQNVRHQNTPAEAYLARRDASALACANHLDT
jgi:hypothetical protein